MPVDVSGSRTKMLGAVAFTSVVATACGAVTLVYGAPGISTLPLDDADVPTFDARIPKRDASCLSAVEPVVGVAPSLGRGVCTAAMVEELREGVRAPMTLDEVAARYPECSRCAFGPSVYGEDAGVMQLGALLSPFGPIVNSDACIALLIGRDDCALELGVRALCEFESCVSCGGEPASIAACRAANDRVCGDKSRPECLTAVQFASNEIIERCSAPFPTEAFSKVATAFCGAPVDGGADGGPLDSGAD